MNNDISDCCQSGTTIIKTDILSTRYCVECTKPCTIFNPTTMNKNTGLIGQPFVQDSHKVPLPEKRDLVDTTKLTNEQKYTTMVEWLFVNHKGFSSSNEWRERIIEKLKEVIFN